MRTYASRERRNLACVRKLALNNDVPFSFSVGYVVVYYQARGILLRCLSASRVCFPMFFFFAVSASLFEV